MIRQNKKYTLRDLRKMKRLTVDGCMLVTKVSKATWYRIEQGQAKTYTDELKEIAKLAGIKFEQLDVSNLKVVR